MPTYHIGDIWTAYDMADLFLITTNSTIKANGTLVMGSGIAAEAQKRFPELPLALGRQIKLKCGHHGKYGLIITPRWPQAKLGILQTKTDWRKPSDMTLIRHGLDQLAQWCADHPAAHVHLNFPGIGHGSLNRDDLLPLINQLPDTVHIWEKTASVPTVVTAVTQPVESSEPPTAVAEEATLETILAEIMQATIPESQDDFNAQLIQAIKEKRWTANGWMHDPTDVDAMILHADNYFAWLAKHTSEYPLSAVEREFHIFTTAFYRGCAWVFERLTVENIPNAQSHEPGFWVQGAAYFVKNVPDAYQAADHYRERVASQEIPVKSGIYTDGIQKLHLTKKLRHCQESDQSLVNSE